mgnify:CR=1 FL=1
MFLTVTFNDPEEQTSAVHMDELLSAHVIHLHSGTARGGAYPHATLERLRKSAPLRWVFEAPAAVAKANFLQGPDAAQFTALEALGLVELRALCACLPESRGLAWASDGDGRKAAWARAHGLAGVMLWEAGQDSPRASHSRNREKTRARGGPGPRRPRRSGACTRPHVIIPRRRARKTGRAPR